MLYFVLNLLGKQTPGWLVGDTTFLIFCCGAPILMICDSGENTVCKAQYILCLQACLLTKQLVPITVLRPR